VRDDERNRREHPERAYDRSHDREPVRLVHGLRWFPGRHIIGALNRGLRYDAGGFSFRDLARALAQRRDAGRGEGASGPRGRSPDGMVLRQFVECLA
jgi:hypothetical protein